MGIRGLGRSKAKAALALARATTSSSVETRLAALELVDFTAIGDGVYYNGGIGNKVHTVTSASSPYTLSTGNSVVLVDASGGATTITMPTPTSAWDATNGASLVNNISKIDSSTNFVTINPSASETIAGETSFDLELQNECLTLITNGTNWYLKD